MRRKQRGTSAEKDDGRRPRGPFPDSDEGVGESWIPRLSGASALQPGSAHQGTLCVSSVILPQAGSVLIGPPPFFSSNLNREVSGNYTKGAGGSLS